MNVGDLVRPLTWCGAVGEKPKVCDSALVIKKYPKGSSKNPWEPGYETTEFDLICSCGEFPAGRVDLGVIDEPG